MSHGDVLRCGSDELHGNTGQSGGMKRMAAFVGVNDKICASLMTAEPHSSSAIHHHGTCETVIYAISGTGAVVFGPNGSKRKTLKPGDWALIPAHTLHQEVNDGDEQVVWAITRTGREPIVENVDGWGDASEAESPNKPAHENHAEGIPA